MVKFKIVAVAFTLFAFAESVSAAGAGANDLKQLLQRLPVGVYMGKNPQATSGTDVCSVKVTANARQYTVLVDPPWSVSGNAQAVFRVSIGDPLVCTPSSAATDAHCNIELQTGVLLGLTLGKNSDGTFEVSVEFDGVGKTAWATCNITR